MTVHLHTTDAREGHLADDPATRREHVYILLPRVGNRLCGADRLLSFLNATHAGLARRYTRTEVLAHLEDLRTAHRVRYVAGEGWGKS